MNPEQIRLRTEAAMKAGLSLQLIDRLRGKTAEELEADARGLVIAIMEFLAARQAPGSPDGLGDLAGLSPADVRARYGAHANNRRVIIAKNF